MVETFTEGQSAPADTAASTPPASAPASTPSLPSDNRDRPALDKSPSQQIRDAARALANRRRELREQAAAAQPPAPPERNPLLHQGEAAQPQAGPSETQEIDPVVELSPIEPPRSWKKEDKDAFNSLPRNVQEKVAENERVREADILQRQNAVSERQRAYEAELGQMAQIRQQYEHGINNALQMTLTNNEFADIQTMQDVEALARDNWPRWVQYQTHQQKVGMLQQQLQEVQHQNYQEQASQWNHFAEQQDQAFSQKYPDAKSLKTAAVEYLKDAGFDHQEIVNYWNSSAWRDARMQGIILDAVKYRQAKAKAAEAVKKPVPEVQKPGVSAPKANPFQAQISELENKGALSLREAAKLNQMRRMVAAKK